MVSRLSDGQLRYPKQHGIQHVVAHHDQYHAAYDLESAPVSGEGVQVFEPAYREGSDGKRDGAAERERKEQNDAKQDRADTGRHTK